ncbi:MAG: hypothetical protein JSV96_02625 [Candidatus Aminicenantes bacterium]|nr:MAG: hypothetical protein JSV96_02625 [Candidatus Aminicenantes bacterium]
MKGAFLLLLSIFFVLGTLLFLNAQNDLKGIDMDSIISVLESHKIDHFIFSNSRGNKFLVVPRFGARILSVSVGGENLFWTHPDILKGQGGQRSWISPEGGAKGFIFKPDWKGNRDFSMLDPGNYKVAIFQENEHLALQNAFQTTSNDGKEEYDLTLTREVRHEEDPLEEDPEFEGAKYDFLGIDFVHSLKNNSDAAYDNILGLWCLIQIPPQGTMIVPVHEVEREAWRDTYFEPIPDEFVKSNPDSFSYYIHGSQRYKVGVRPESAQGLICYFSKTKKEDYFMVFMTFPVKPEGRYVDRPRPEQQTNGDAIQLYSHLEKDALAFGELECQSWALDLKPGGEQAFPIKTYIYKASFDVLQKIGKKLICPQFDKACLFNK